MSFATAMTAIGAHLVTVGAAQDPAIIDVQRGAPVSVPVPLIRYWYAGNTSLGETFTNRMQGERVTISAMWPVSDRGVLADLDERIHALAAAIFTALLGDSQLGGACDDLDVGDADVDYPVVNGQQVADLTITVTLQFLESYTIAP